MPSVSQKQHNFFAAVAKNPKFAKKAGVPASVGEEFLKADKGLKFGKGSSRADIQKVNRPKTEQGKSELFAKGGDMKDSKMNPGFMAMMAKKKDGMHKMPDGKMMKNSAMKKMAKGGVTRADGVIKKAHTKGRMV
jgi:hypothetical protein